MSVSISLDRNFVAAVTGGAGGIGAATAMLFADSGASVYVIDRDAGAAAALAGARGDDAITAIEADVADAEAVATAFSQIEKERGGLDALVTSAGIAVHGAAGELTLEEWDRGINVNLRGTWLSVRAALPLLRHRPQSALVLLSSVHAFRTIPRYAAYAVAKAGIVALARSLAIDYASDGVHVHAVCPGGVETAMTLDVLREHDALEDTSAFTSRYPLQRFGQPEEIARLVVWLSALDCPFMTGAPVIVDGGLLALTR